MKAIFLTYHEGTILVEGHQSTFLSSYIELNPTVSYEKIFKVFYIGKICSAP